MSVYSASIKVKLWFSFPLYFFSYSAGGFVLSSTSLYFDSCLYARNTINAMMMKSIIVDIRSPYLNSVVDNI